MPRRHDIKSVLILGAGPIVIGQAAEFDYSGTQALKVLRKEGYRLVLVNPNPATIMTDPELAHATYVEPLVPEVLEAIIARERPDALLPTVGGQTALNLAVSLAEAGVLERYGVEVVGASLRSIRLAEDRQAFKEAVEAAGLAVPASTVVRSVEEALGFSNKVGFPLLIRPSFTLGGTGAGVAASAAELAEKVQAALRLSPVGSALVEESLIGWKEYELEVMHDAKGTFVVVCSIENLDPMGIHTGDSVTVAPAQTLTDKEYQRLRDWARAVMAAVGVQTGGANVQFALNPHDGSLRVIEMNPRVSRSSALASKATGFPIAKIAALVAVGYTLDELLNDVTGSTVAAFEPALDYVVVKIPRWDLEKFPGANDGLGPQMKSVGEAMAIGRSFKEALQKALRSLEIGVRGFEGGSQRRPFDMVSALARPSPYRLLLAHDALAQGIPEDEVASATGWDRWFVAQMAELVALEAELRSHSLQSLPAHLLHRAKQDGFSDAQLAGLLACSEEEVRQRRKTLGLAPCYLQVDTCAGEFEAVTPYFYSSYGSVQEAVPDSAPSVVVLGSGPNRIGQGIEFDYGCCHAATAIREMGFRAIMVNCNPETVSTDYDTSDRLYFEPLTLEDVLNVVERERPVGVIVQFGGQTALGLTLPLARAGVPILGTPADAVDLAEDRGSFGALLSGLNIPQPQHGVATSPVQAARVAKQIGYPVMVRPSYVLGGRSMAVCHDEASLLSYTADAVGTSADRPLLIDRFLEDAYELEVDALCDGRRVFVGGILQHIEAAGVHSGDSACVLPPYKVSRYHLDVIEDYTRRIALALGVRGLINLQFAIKDDVVYVLEANPRASRTLPFISKATGLPLARLATRIMLGQDIEQLGLSSPGRPAASFFVKEAVLPFQKLPGADAVLGPEMKATGEVMGWARGFGYAFAKAQMAAGCSLPRHGQVLISVNDHDKGQTVKVARDLMDLGFSLLATRGTARFLSAAGLQVEVVNKVSEGSYHVVDAIRSGRVALVINTPLGPGSYTDGMLIRLAATQRGVPLVTTLSAAAATVQAIKALREGVLEVASLQELYRQNGRP